MTTTPSVGREHVLEQLVAVAEHTRAGHGAVVFLSGPTGSGKSALLRQLAGTLAARPEDERPELEMALCYETSAGNPLGPFGEVLRALTNRERRGDRAKRVLELVGQVAPPLVELIPVIGKLAALGVKAASEVGIYALGGSHEAQQAQLASDVTAALQRIADDTPLVVVIDDAHWIDTPSTEVVARVAQAPDEHALTLLIAYDDSLVDDRHPLARVRSTVAGRAGVSALELGDLSRDAVDGLLRARYGTLPDPRLGEWLHDRTDGSPLFVEQYLASLEAAGVLRQDDGGWKLDGAIEGEPGAWQLHGALAEAHAPDTLLELLRPRVADLDADERTLLETGAVQGRRFLSSVLVQLLAREEDEILDRLAQVAERRRMISSEEAEDWWSEHGALYAFDPGILQELLYGRYARSPYERRRRHRAVAEALEALIAHDDPPPRHALLEIARHYEEARMPLKAAARLVRVAESTFAEGADRETAAHAAHAVELLHGAPKEELTPPESQKLLARAIILLLLGGEPSWRADTDADGARFVELAEEAQRAADAAGDPKLGANARYAAALVATAYQGLDKTVAAYRDALERARAAADPVAEFAILVSLGHQLDSVDLREGRDVLRQAHELLESGALAAALDEAHLAAEEARLEMSIGVAEFDLGNYGEALDRLGHSSQRLRQVRKRDDVAWSLSFLGQVYIAIGLYEAAEATLGEACALFADESAALGIRGYLKGLLGHLYVEWDRLDDARGQLVSARDETRASGFRAVIPLVEGYSAELLLAEGTPESLRAVEEALGSLESFGWARSEIAAASLRARAALAAGKVDDARELSTRAVDELERRGGFVPAVRSEEILFAHARILSAAGAPDAAQWLEQAKRVVGAKADSLTDPAQRTSFVERVRLSREILAA